MSLSRNESFELKLSEGSRVQATDFGDFVLIKCSSRIASLGRSIYEANFDFVDEVIATEVEICLVVNEQYDAKSLFEIERLKIDCDNSDPIEHEFGIWFSDEFDDWSLICNHTGLSKNDYIDQLLGCEFNIAMLGFLPGFVYLSGLPDSLHVPRKTNPATRTLPNTFAVGGKYGGIYSLPSAAGWNCVGRIANRFFDPNELSPLSITQGDRVKLKRIDAQEFSDSSITWNIESRVTQSIGGSKSLTIIKPGLLTLIQDRGRTGLAYFAIPQSGPLDSQSAELANTILGNDQDAAVIECHFVAPTIRFDSPATICLTGANFKWRIDGQKVKRNQTINVESESVLSGSAAKKGCRAYIGIAGQIQTTTSFGSMSCYLPGRFGGNEGRQLAAGDKLHWKAPVKLPVSLHLDITSTPKDDVITFVPGPEFDWLDESSKTSLFAHPFHVTVESDRMGTRLQGPEISTQQQRLTDSVPLIPGMIQLTPGGQCIVVLQDGQTTGGYPRIGYLSRSSLNRLSQTKIGHPFWLRMAE